MNCPACDVTHPAVVCGGLLVALHPAFLGKYEWNPGYGIYDPATNLLSPQIAQSAAEASFVMNMDIEYLITGYFWEEVSFDIEILS